MSKIALIGDTHCGHSKSSDIFHDYFEKSFDWMFTEFRKRKIEAVIQTGDLFDYRREVHFNTLYRSTEYFLKPVLEYPFTVISGNHDCLYKNTNRINSVRLLLGHTDAIIVDEHPTSMMVGGIMMDFYPWINDSNMQECIDFATNTTSEYAVGHFEFAHFPMSPGNDSVHGMDHTIFKNYKRVYSGHYHTQSTRDNIQYTGTPYEMTWVDCNDPKGFWILDTKSGEQEFVKNPHSLFAKIEYTEGMAFDFKSVTGKYVKLIETTKQDQKAFDKFIDKINAAKPIDLKIIGASFVAAVSTAVGKSVDTVSTQSVITGVVDNLDTPLDRDKLKHRVMSKYTEALSISNQL